MTFPGNDPLDEVAAASRRYQFSAGLGDIPDTKEAAFENRKQGIQ